LERLFFKYELKKIKLRNISSNHINNNKSNEIIFKRLKTISKFFRLLMGKKLLMISILNNLKNYFFFIYISSSIWIYLEINEDMHLFFTYFLFLLLLLKYLVNSFSYLIVLFSKTYISIFRH